MKAMRMEEAVQQYLWSKQNAWSKSTLKSERARIMSTVPLDIPVDAFAVEHVKEKLPSLAPYTRNTLWIRIVDLVEWLIQRNYIQGPNYFKIWQQDNRQLFKYNYERKTPSISYSEALTRIETITDEQDYKKAVQLLTGGLRWAESFTVTEDGWITGKGNKTRQVFVKPVEYHKSYNYFRKTLQQNTGLKPHDLRKIKATELVRRGANLFQLCYFMGWSNTNTGLSYINAGQIEELGKIANG